MLLGCVQVRSFGLGILDDHRYELQHAARARRLAVVRWLRGLLAHRLAGHLLLCVRADLREGIERLQALQCLVQDVDGGSLVHDGGLEQLVLLLPLLSRLLQVHIHLRLLVGQFLDLGVQGLQCVRELFVLVLQVLLGDLSLLDFILRFVDLRHAGIVLFILVLLLVFHLRQHRVQGGLGLAEGVDAHAGSQGGQLEAPVAPRRHCEAPRRLCDARPGGRGRGGHLHKVRSHGLHEEVASILCRQDLQSLGKGDELLAADLRARVVVRVLGRTVLADVGEEVLIGRHARRGRLHVLLRLGRGGAELRQPPGLALTGLRGDGDLRLFRRTELVELGLGLEVSLLGLAEVSLHLVVHLREDAEDAAALGVVRFRPGGRALEPVRLGGQESGCARLHGRGLVAPSAHQVVEVAGQEVLELGVRAHDIVVNLHQSRRSLRPSLARLLASMHELHELHRGDRGDGVLQEADGLLHVRLIGEELGLLLLAQGGRRVQGVLVARHVRLDGLDGLLEAAHGRRGLIDEGLELLDA
mmetsp:Transcript_23605/g.60164  ORF Transcript_23605/g.60164 Transcript_23605/m.60164 type:complete len:527 (+) Transcript_23605:1400-2980(+)